MPSPGIDRQRIDKWLWHARMVRTRSDAAALTQAGYVRINGKRITAPGRIVRLGDIVTLALDRSVRVIRVEAFCERRGQAPAARALYREMTTSSGAKASAASSDSRKVPPPARRQG
jgi:ribosome-associated heat shock protein Hsp15